MSSYKTAPWDRIVNSRIVKGFTMKNGSIRGLWLLAALLLTVSALDLRELHEMQDKQRSQIEGSLRFYPLDYDRRPELPSPTMMEDGTEILVALTQDNKFVIIPVTIEKGDPLGYRERDWDKIGILEVDKEDFPTLAQNGLHSEIELDHTRWITGRSIAEITDSGRPGGSSGAGFMSQEEDIISVLKGDNRLVRKVGLTHPQLAKPLFHVWNMIRWIYAKNEHVGRTISDIEYFLYNGKQVRLLHAGGRGWQNSIFNDEILGMYQIELCIELDEAEKVYLHEKYPELNNAQLTEFLKMLSYIHTGEMVPFYIMRYGFYEGHTDYRADPIALSLIFGLKSLEDIEEAFQGNLFGELTEHFTHENISAGARGHAE